MSELSFPQLLDVIRGVQSAYHKLVVIAAPSRSGKTRLLNQIAFQIPWGWRNLYIADITCIFIEYRFPYPLAIG